MWYFYAVGQFYLRVAGSRVADGEVHHILEDELRIDVVVVDVGNLDDDARDFGEEDADGEFFAVGLGDFPDGDIRPCSTGSQGAKGGHETSVAHGDAGLDHTVFHQFAQHLIAVHEVVRVRDIGGSGGGGAHGLGQRRAAQTVFASVEGDVDYPVRGFGLESASSSSSTVPALKATEGVPVARLYFSSFTPRASM